jgi:hypothetical protein
MNAGPTLHFKRLRATYGVPNAIFSEREPKRSDIELLISSASHILGMDSGCSEKERRGYHSRRVWIGWVLEVKGIDRPELVVIQRRRVKLNVETLIRIGRIGPCAST